MSKDKLLNEQECPIKKYTPKSWFSALILGVFVGLAVIVPGVSGSTIAIIFGLYASMLYAFGNIFNDFRRCFIFLIPIGVGVVVGFAAGFLVIQKYFEPYVFQIICLFVGLMIGAVPALTREIRGEKKTVGRGALFVIGIIIPIAVGIVSVFLSGGTDSVQGAAFESIEIGRILAYLPLGFAVSLTQIVPGLSATAILMATGQFKPILNSLHTDYILENPGVLFLYGALALGFAAGIVLVSRAFSAILARHKAEAFFMVIGLSFGSIASMFLNTDVWGVYTEWAAAGRVPTNTLFISAGLMAAGFVLSFALTRYELSHSE